MVDIYDQATAREEQDRELALLRHRQRQTAAAGPAPTLCEDCGNPIPPARQAAVPGVAVCLDCQVAAERHAKLYPWS